VQREVDGKRFGTLKTVVRDVLGDRKSLGWSFADTDLKLLRYGKGEEV